MKKLSVITINYNNRDGLRKTIESVVAQTTRDFEYIVIDGGSTDGSVEVIKEYASYIDYWVSEPDKGIYNAMNKGACAAHGLFCQFLNSGDWLNSTIVVEVINSVLSNDFDILTGYTITVDKDNKYKRKTIGSPKILTKYSILNNSISHPSSFTKRELLLKYPFDEKLKIVADWKFFVEALILHGARYRHIDFDATVFNLDGISSVMAKEAREEGVLLRNSLVNPDILAEISNVPPEIVSIFQRIPNSDRLKKLIVAVTGVLVGIYETININHNKLKYSELPPPEVLRNVKRNCRLLR